MNQRLRMGGILCLLGMCSAVALRFGVPARAQMPDRTQNPNGANFGIAKSLIQEIGAGRGNWTT